MCSIKATRQQSCTESPKAVVFRDVFNKGYKVANCNESQKVAGFRYVITEGYKAAKLP